MVDLLGADSSNPQPPINRDLLTNEIKKLLLDLKEFREKVDYATENAKLKSQLTKEGWATDDNFFEAQDAKIAELFKVSERTKKPIDACKYLAEATTQHKFLSMCVSRMKVLTEAELREIGASFSI